MRVDRRLPGTRVEHEGEGALARDADADQLGNLARYGADLDRDLRAPPPGSADAALQPSVAGGNAKFTSGSTWTCSAGAALPPPPHAASAAATRTLIVAPSMRLRRAPRRCGRVDTALPGKREACGRYRYAHPEDEHREGKRKAAPAGGRADVQAECGPMVFRHHAVRVASGAHALDVGRRRGGGEADAPPRLMCAPAQVAVP
jgi:hypothetical protein